MIVIKEEDVLKIPLAPIVNRRIKIKYEEEQATKELIRYMEELTSITEDNANYQRDLKHYDEIVLPLDKEFVWSPMDVTFNVDGNRLKHYALNNRNCCRIIKRTRFTRKGFA